MKDKEIVKTLVNGQMTESEETKVWNRLDDYEFEQKFRAYIQHEEGKQRQPSLKTVWIKHAFLARAAAVLVLVTAGWFGVNYQATPQYERLSAAYLEEIPPSVVTKLGVEPTNVDINWQNAKLAYGNQKFDEAAIHLKKIEAHQALTYEQHFYIGISLMCQTKKDNASAIQHLLKVRQDGDGWNAADINWYLALAYIQNKQFVEARQELMAIRTTTQTDKQSETQKSKATNLVRALDQSAK